MMPSLEKKHEARVLLVIWLALIASTVSRLWLADAGATARASPASISRTAGWVLGFSALKGLLIAIVFMEMWQGPRVWVFAMSAFLLAEAALLFGILL